VQQDWQEQPVVDVAGVEQRRPIRHPQPHGSVESLAPGARIDIAVGLASVHWLEPIRGGRQNATDVVVASCDGTDTFSRSLVCAGGRRSGPPAVPRLLSSALTCTVTKLGALPRAGVADWRRQAVSSPRATPLRRATSEMLASSSIIVAGDHLDPTIRVYESPSCLTSSMAFAIAHLQDQLN
jgi:hypothetical protein